VHSADDFHSDRRNLVALLIDYVLFGAGLSFIGMSTVLPTFVRLFTDSAPVIGLVTTVWNGAWLIPQLAAANAINHLPRKKPALLRMGFLGRISMFPIALALMLGLWQWPGWMLTLFFAMLTLFWVSDAYCSIAWFDIVGKSVPANRRGRLFGAGQVGASLLAIGIGAFVRWILSAQGPGFPASYAWLFALSSITLLLALGALATIHEPLEEVNEERLGWRSYVPRLIQVLKEQHTYRNVIIAWLLCGLSSMATPFYVLYATDRLGLGAESVGVFIIAQTIGGLLGSLGLGALAERRGSGAVIRMTVVVTITAPLAALALYFIPPANWTSTAYMWVFIVLGIIGSSSMLGWQNYMLGLAPPGQRPTYMGLSNTLAGLLVLAPVMGGWLLGETSYLVLFTAAVIGPMLAWAIAMRLPASQSAGI
jgi:MFS family permease